MDEVMASRMLGMGGDLGVKVLAVPVPAILPGTPCQQVFDTIREKHDIPGLPVIREDGRILGLVSRATCLSILSKPIMYDLYCRRPVERIMEKAPLTVEGDVDLAALSTHIAKECPRALSSGFIIVENGRYLGIGSAINLMAHMAAQAQDRSAALEAARWVAEEANRAKSTFLANLSHEIRTPLNGVLANLELLRLSNLPGETGELVEGANITALALFDLIGDVLDLSKIEAGKLSIERIPLSPSALLREIGMLMTNQAHQCGLEFTVQIGAGVPPVILGDPLRLRQVVLNLCGNALKFTRTGGIHLNCWTIERQGQLWLMIEVADTGVGFDPRRSAALFEPFIQEDASTTRRFGGTGLGLAICKRLMEMMGGTIHNDGAPDAGASFWCLLPLSPEDRVDSPPIEDIAGTRVLVVHGDARAAARLAAQLELAGAFPTLLEDPGEALRTLRATPADAAFTAAVIDFSTPQARESWPIQALHATGVPLVMLADWEDVVTRRAGYRAGFTVAVDAAAPSAELVRAVALASGRRYDHQPRPHDDAIPALIADLAQVSMASILVIDDNVMNRSVAGRQFKHLGLACDFAENGVDALVKVETATSYDLILCDCQMPEMDGYEFTRRLRAREVRFQMPRCPVVAMTANALQGDVERCLEAGMDDYISKPVKIARLAATIRRWLIGESGARHEEEHPPLPEPPSDAGPPVDLEELGEILGDDDPSTLRQVLAFFRETYEPLEERLRTRAAGRDRDGLRAAAHAAKGAARNAATPSLALCLEAVEAEAPAADWPRLDALVTVATSASERVGEFIDAYVQER